MLFVFLESLPEPIVEDVYYAKIMKSYQQFALLKQTIGAMREPNKSTFQYLIKFLARVVEENSGINVKELCKFIKNSFKFPRMMNIKDGKTNIQNSTLCQVYINI